MQGRGDWECGGYGEVMCRNTAGRSGVEQEGRYHSRKHLVIEMQETTGACRNVGCSYLVGVTDLATEPQYQAGPDP